MAHPGRPAGYTGPAYPEMDVRDTVSRVGVPVDVAGVSVTVSRVYWQQAPHPTICVDMSVVNGSPSRLSYESYTAFGLVSFNKGELYVADGGSSTFGQWLEISPRQSVAATLCFGRARSGRYVLSGGAPGFLDGLPSTSRADVHPVWLFDIGPKGVSQLP